MAGSTRWFDDGVERHETADSYAFHAGDEPSFIVDESDVRVPGDGNGVVLTTPDGSGRYLLRVDNDGKLITEAVDEDGGDE